MRLGAREGPCSVTKGGRRWRPASSLARCRLPGTTCVTRSGCKTFTPGGLRRGSPHVALLEAGRVATSRIGGPLRDSPSVLQAYCYPSSSRGEGKERENVRIAVVTRRSEQSANKCMGPRWRFAFQDVGHYSGPVGQRPNLRCTPCIPTSVHPLTHSGSWKELNENSSVNVS